MHANTRSYICVSVCVCVCVCVCLSVSVWMWLCVNVIMCVRKDKIKLVFQTHSFLEKQLRNFPWQQQQLLLLLLLLLLQQRRWRRRRWWWWWWCISIEKKQWRHFPWIQPPSPNKNKINNNIRTKNMTNLKIQSVYFHNKYL